MQERSNATLHLRAVDGVPVLFDGEGRRLYGVQSLTVTTEVNGFVQANVVLVLNQPTGLTNDVPAS